MECSTCAHALPVLPVLPVPPVPQVDPAYRLFVADGSRGAASYALAVLRAAEAQLVRPELREAVREAAAAVLPLQVCSGCYPVLLGPAASKRYKLPKQSVIPVLLLACMEFHIHFALNLSLSALPSFAVPPTARLH